VEAQEKTCTNADVIAAINSFSALKNWTDIYKAFKRFRHCDDGAVAEGFSDRIVHTLASRWTQLGTLRKLPSSDSRFHVFVLSHIDATADEDEIKKIGFNSTRHCPPAAKILCVQLRKAARDALREIPRAQ
jgi:hypothetical protein